MDEQKIPSFYNLALEKILNREIISRYLFFSDHQLLSPVAVAGLMGCIVACLDVKTTLLGKSHYLLYSLATAIQVGLLI